MYLKRYHDIQISSSGVWRILKRLELNRLPAHRVQLDMKFISPLPGSRRKHYQFTAIDDCTRLRVLRIYPKLSQHTAIQFLHYVLERLPFRVEVIQTDNGPEFGASFHWQVLDKGAGASSGSVDRKRLAPPVHCCPQTIRVERRASGDASSVLAIGCGGQDSRLAEGTGSCGIGCGV
jgi:hypothetical protein